MLLFHRRKAISEISEEEKFITELYAKYHGLMKNIAMKVLNNAMEAEDIIQEVFLFILPKVSKIITYEDYQIKNYSCYDSK